MNEYFSRPKASCKAARIAWDMFAKQYGDRLKSLRYCYMDYYVWVAKLDSLDPDEGDYEEIDAISVTSVLKGYNVLLYDHLPQ